MSAGFTAGSLVTGGLLRPALMTWMQAARPTGQYSQVGMLIWSGEAQLWIMDVGVQLWGQ